MAAGFPWSGFALPSPLLADTSWAVPQGIGSPTDRLKKWDELEGAKTGNLGQMNHQGGEADQPR